MFSPRTSRVEVARRRAGTRAWVASRRGNACSARAEAPSPSCTTLGVELILDVVEQRDHEVGIVLAQMPGHQPSRLVVQLIEGLATDPVVQPALVRHVVAD